MNEILNCPICGAMPEVRNDGGFVTVYHESSDCWCEARSVSLCAWNQRAGEPRFVSIKHTTALENVLAKLRVIAASYPESNDNCTMCREITLGDLRRWIESEGK